MSEQEKQNQADMLRDKYGLPCVEAEPTQLDLFEEDPELVIAVGLLDDV